MESGLLSGVKEDPYSVSYSEIVWAKSVHGVWGLSNVFANGKLYFMRDVPEAHCLLQGLELPTKPASKAANPRAKPSIKSAAKLAAKVAAKPATGDPILVAPAEHVQLFRVKYCHQKQWHTESLLLSRAQRASQQIVPGSFVVHTPSYCIYMCCFVLRVWCIILGGARGPSFGAFWGTSPRGCEGTIFPGRLLCKGRVGATARPW